MPEGSDERFDWESFAVAAFVTVGLAAAVGVSAYIGTPSGKLPGIALGSAELLFVERAVALFAAWLLGVVVVAQALKGKLPTEISGRGLKYADAEKTEDTVKKIQQALAGIDEETKSLRADVSDLQIDVAESGRS